MSISWHTCYSLAETGCQLCQGNYVFFFLLGMQLISEATFFLNVTTAITASVVILFRCVMASRVCLNRHRTGAIT